MPKAGRPRSNDARIRAHVAVVAATWNAPVTDRLLAGAVEALQRAGATHETFRVPGSFELPAAVARLAATKRFDAIVPLGCLVRGDTPHFHYLAEAVAGGLQRLTVETDVPIAFGVLTCDTLAQALDRAGGAEGNKGADAAEAALQTLDFVRSLRATGGAKTSRRTERRPRTR